MGIQIRKIPYGYTFYPVLWKGEAYAVDLLWSRDGIVSGYVIVHICQYMEKKIILYGHSGKRLFNAGKIYNEHRVPLLAYWIRSLPVILLRSTTMGECAEKQSITKLSSEIIYFSDY